MKIVQLNLNGQRVASLQLRDYCANNKVNIALIQEPVYQNGKIYGFEDCRVIAADKPGAAIIIMDSELQAVELSKHSTTYIAAVKIGHEPKTLTLVSAYFKYNMHTTWFTDKLRSILEDGRETIIGADTNGHSPKWHSRDLNQRGRVVEDLIDDFNLHVINSPGNLDTYARRGMGASNIDVTMCTQGMKDDVTEWRVYDVTDSDHRLLSFTIDLPAPRTSHGGTKYNEKKANWVLFSLELIRRTSNITNSADVNVYATTITSVITAAASASIPVVRNRRWAIKRQPWWSNRLTNMKKSLNQSRRQGLRLNDRPAYNRLRNEYLTEIRKSKMESWRNLSNDINSDTWGKAFKYAKNGPRAKRTISSLKMAYGTHTESVEDTMKILLDTFVPEDPNTVDFTEHGPIERYTLVTEEQVKNAIWRMKPSRAPGLDGISAGILRKAWPVMRGIITDLMNRCLESATFPNCWKTAKLVIIPKPGKKDMTSPKAYRPISLLPTIGKALETLIIANIEKETPLNEIGNQHGFVSGRSTTSAMSSLYGWVDQSSSRHVFGVFLDITGAFDNVKWTPILERLREIGASIRTIRMVTSYLSDRYARLQIEQTIREKKLTRGCPQGSQLGPTLWKVAMTDIRTPPDDRIIHVIKYADDIAIMIGAARPATAFNRMTEYLDEMKNWARKYELQFSAEKTQLMSVKGGLKPTYNIAFGTGDDAEAIRSSSTVKYLGVLLDPRRSYVDHIFGLAQKSKDMYKRLRHMMSANWGMDRIAARKIYKGVFLPRITYAAEIWWEGVLYEKCKKKLGSMQRDPLRAITSAYNTASTNCLTAVAGELPLDLEITKQVFKRKLRLGLITPDEYKHKIDELLETWQNRYVATEKGEWTKKMIPSVVVRYHLPLQLDYYTTQILTGHGDFKGKLYSFKLVDSPTCECALGGSETVAHVLLRCRRTETFREVLQEALYNEGETWPPEDGVFLKTKKLYEALRKFAISSMKDRTDR